MKLKNESQKLVSNDRYKRLAARLVGWKPVRLLLALTVRLVVARQRVGVALVGFDEDGRILMLNHVFHPVARWGVPGGWMNRGESPAECALRELREETGLTAKLGPVVHVSHESIPPHIGIAYAATIESGAIQLSSEILEAYWYKHDELPKPILPFVQDAIDAAISYPDESMNGMRVRDE